LPQSILPRPASSSSTFAAEKGRLEPDEDERLELERLPFDRAVAMADNGEIEDAKSIVGLLRVARQRE